MILFYIYLIISVATLLQFLFMTMDASMKLKKLYPNIPYEKHSLGEILGICLRVILLSFIPIVNIIMSLTLLFKYEDLVESSISDIYEKYKNQIDKETNT